MKRLSSVKFNLKKLVIFGIKNPKFALPAIPTNSYSSKSSTSFPEWTFSGNTNSLYISNGTSPFNDTVMPTGTTQALVIQFRTDIGYSIMYFTQSISITTPKTYTVSFYSRPRPPPNYFDPSMILTVSLNGSSVNTSTLTTTSSWTLFSFTTYIPQGYYTLQGSVVGGSGDTSVLITGITVV